MFERVVWQYWETSDEYPNGIPYIDLCHQSVDNNTNNGIGYKVIRLNEKTVFDYIDINPFLLNIKGSPNQLAQKADYIRAKLLCKYGGIWIDSDSIVLNSMDPIFDKLENLEFYGYKIKAPCVWGFACHKDAEIMKKWCANNEKILDETKGNNIFFGELGHKSLQNFMDCPNSFFDNANETVHQIDHRYAWKYMEMNNLEPEEFIKPDQPFIMLNNTLIYDKIKKMSKEQLKEQKILLTKFFKKAKVL
jgi:hypothetical protein